MFTLRKEIWEGTEVLFSLFTSGFSIFFYWILARISESRNKKNS